MIPANELLNKNDRIHIFKTRKDPNRTINIKERKVIMASLEEYKNAGSESSKMIWSSIDNILGFYDRSYE